MTKYCFGLFALVLVAGVMSAPQTRKEAAAQSEVVAWSVSVDELLMMSGLGIAPEYLKGVASLLGGSPCLSPGPCQHAEDFWDQHPNCSTWPIGQASCNSCWNGCDAACLTAYFACPEWGRAGLSECAVCCAAIWVTCV